MGNILRNAVEKKRRKIIEKLIAFDVYEKEDHFLYEFSLTELEHEYRRFRALNHPHTNFSSIHLTNKENVIEE
ncbi:Fur-regulated basic protein FbpA [Neobacillus sp. LXY-1]|uniref:Fur-regulated basic protein FbpA n=1 Tax=Neobacillus sp. LXY-1 TaxID=3379133 RepID=UPI003EE20CCF